MRHKIIRLTTYDRATIRDAANYAGIDRRRNGTFYRLAEQLGVDWTLAQIADIKRYREDPTHPLHEIVREQVQP